MEYSMDYHEIPPTIKKLTDESVRCGYVLQHVMPKYRDNKTNKIKIIVGDLTVEVDSSELEVFMLKQIEYNKSEITRLEDIHETLTKVAGGLIN